MNKKGIDGAYYLISLIIGAALGGFLIWYAISQGILPVG